MDKNERKENNLKILKKLESCLNKYPDIRFIQALWSLHIVDELDRCIPEYAVKVLERLHHLTENQSNIITVIAIDKPQLTASVKQLFGFEHPERYLEIFINFEIKTLAAGPPIP